MKKRAFLSVALCIALAGATVAQAAESILINNLSATPSPAPTPLVTATPEATSLIDALLQSRPQPTKTYVSPQPDPTAAPTPDTSILNEVYIPPEALATPEPRTMPYALYVGEAQQNIAIRTEMSREAPAVGNYQIGESVYIVDYAPEWLLVVRGDENNWVSGYVLRHTVSPIYSLGDGYLPYGATPAVYSAVLTSMTTLYTEPAFDRDVLHTFTPGTKVAILEIVDGWAKVIHSRRYGYFYLDAADSLTPVYDVYAALSGDTISAFISFYNTSTTGLNPNRMYNIALACDYISIVMQPGDEFAFNSVAGPYLRTRGYEQAPSFVQGETVPSYGGGTCQVSSTLYNTLLPLTVSGITITYRRPHGPSGAKYLPHGVDAAVGSSTLDLRFRNDYGFAVRIEASSQDGVLYIAMLKA